MEGLRKVGPLNGLFEDEYRWLATHGQERRLASGTTLFLDGDPTTTMSIILQGEMHVRRERASNSLLFVGRSGQLTGLLPFSRMKFYGGTGYCVGDVWGIEIDCSLFPAMLAAIPSMAQRSVNVLLDRVREVTRMEQQTEKLNALGKLAGNLAHELNNPASAAQRAASGLLDELRVYGRQKYELGSICLEPGQLEQMGRWQEEVRATTRERVPDPATQLAREDTLLSWLNAHGIENAWQIAPELTEIGITTPQLEKLQAAIGEQTATSSKGRSALGVVLSQFASSLRAEHMTEAMLDSTARIFELIAAIKDYSYMDQAPIQEVDIPQGLETTLTMLQSRLGAIEVERRYEPGLPLVSAYGSELNQVWMALLENAIDSIEERAADAEKAGVSFSGRITLSVQLSGQLILIEVWDNGRGIPPELRDRIFEPFFTTKAPGKGLGLGLDTVQRIVRKHRGYVRVQSEHGETCFQVRFPAEQLQAY
jgi:signal transduction histidine kinase